MRKIYSLLMLLMAFSFSFQSNAAVTAKVNKTGIAYFKSFGPSGETVLNDAVNILPNDCGGMTVGEIHCPAGYSMTAVNETTGSAASITEYDGEQYISVNPGTAPDGTVFNITIVETGGGGGGDLPDDKFLTFVFSPAESGYVVTTRTTDAGVTIEDETFRPAPGEETIEVPYSLEASYIIKPNPGYALLKAMDETQVSNPHYSGDAPRGDGFIYGDMAAYNAGSVIVVTASRNGSFTVRGEGSDLSHIQMQNLSTYDMVTVTSTETAVSFNGGVEYKIYSDSSSPIWKVTVTDAEDYTTSLEGRYGNFFYKPNDGDRVVIYPNKPQMYCRFNLSYSGTGVDSSIIKSVWYGDNEEAPATWANGQWTKEGEDYLRIYFNSEGYTNLSCSINGVAQTLSSDSQGTKYIGFQANNGEETLKEYNIVVSAKKDANYNLTLLCAHPQAVSIAPMTGYTIGTPLAFTQSGQTFKIAESKNKLKFSATSGWKIDGILVNGQEPKAGEFTDGTYFVNASCTITINVTSKAESRTKTAVVYVDESAARPSYLNFQYADQTAVALTPGYNFVPFCDDDLPFSFGYYAGGSAEFFVNGAKIDSPMSCPQTIDLQDGAVIKYFNGTPASYVVSYDIEDEVADLLEIYHDHTSVIDHRTTTQHAVFKGTLIHVKPLAAAAAAKAAPREATKLPFQIKVNDVLIQPDENGVYSIKVEDAAPAIVIKKDFSTGIDTVAAQTVETFDIYNLQGIVVKRNATAADLNSLPAGIYIANGQKVIKK